MTKQETKKDNKSRTALYNQSNNEQRQTQQSSLLSLQVIGFKLRGKKQIKNAIKPKKKIEERQSKWRTKKKKKLPLRFLVKALHTYAREKNELKKECVRGGGGG